MTNLEAEIKQGVENALNNASLMLVDPVRGLWEEEKEVDVGSRIEEAPTVSSVGHQAEGGGIGILSSCSEEEGAKEGVNYL